MQFLPLSLACPAENLALDEALLLQLEERKTAGELLRIWEPKSTFVVLGRSSSAASEVDLDYCQEEQISIWRRTSGGGTILTGPGCLMYSLVLSYEHYPQLHQIDQAHQFVLSRLAQAIGSLIPGVEQKGTSDLVWNDQKFSGNSMRAVRSGILYHGTLLLDFPLEQIIAALKHPPREPAYRQGRDHQQFLCQLKVDTQTLTEAICQAWQVTGERTDWPQEQVCELVETKYRQADWTFAR